MNCKLYKIKKIIYTKNILRYVNNKYKFMVHWVINTTHPDENEICISYFQ